ncbi:amino acid adenylation enzyme/thioester reductase family protein [Xenococcus sp. PCC 7305]|uniref:non-ribosomal peptide synthetase n=1 Tax=Xenococcus sp. PCC 7305 TaxID=102125 RepID=UPI0002AC9444|nr:non-ribosomal peptide synthetase [Xenococcus sp. PCC 7305]ELS00501.1 amino acid adenylation enzyme/thioester reductase family protein [Xenococcus sp. PCC 7305]
MKTINDFLSQLNSLDIKLWTETIPENSSEVRLRCNAPKDVLTSEIKTELTQRKAEILEFLLQLNHTTTEIKPVPRTENLPLSFAQQRLWFLDRLEPGNPFYNQPAALRLTGKLQVEILEQSFQEIIRRHEILRTNFTNIAAQTVQVIKSEVDFQLPLIDLSDLLPKEKPAKIRQIAEQEAEYSFDLERDLLLRVTLLKCDRQEHIILFTTHHIVSDDWSTGILIQEIATLYQAFIEGKPSSLPELSIQYADYAVWQRQWLAGKAQSIQVNYWQQQLGNNLSILNLPTDYPRPTKLTYQGANQSFTLSPALTQALKTLCQKEGVTLFMLLLAAWNVLLHRYSQQTDIVVGTPIANRNREEIENLIGFFVNTLVLRTDLEGNPSFQELLQRVKKVTLGAYSHQDLPFEQLVEELKPERHLNRNPLFDVMFSLQNAPEAELTLPGLTLSSFEESGNTAKFDLSLDMFESAAGLSGVFEYSTDLFASNTIARMIGNFQVLLEAIATQPETAIAQLPLLTKEARQQLLFNWNDNLAEYPVAQSIHILFEQQVAQTPDAIALVFQKQSLTYRQLNEQANQLARCLRDLGLEAGEFIGIYQERSPNFLISILAILKAGAAYIPMDHSYPSARIEYMLSNSQVRFLLVDSGCIKAILNSTQDYADLQYLINLDSESESKLKELTILGSRSWRHLAADNLGISVTGIEPAYMIYTSGSTGLPKGTIIRHGGAINHIYAEYDALSLSSDLTFLQSAPASSDISVWQFLAPLLIGGKTVIINQETLCNPQQLFQVIQQNQITLVELVPVVLRSFVNHLSQVAPEARTLPSLQWMMVTGESVSVDLVNQWLKLYPNIAIVNAYGPSEASDDITQEIITQPLPENSNTVAIGKPLANLNLYLLDSNQQLVPVGVPGEICVSGYGVGLGYWRNEEKTQANFIANPFPETAKPLPGVTTDLLYKTGDLGRWLDNGSIEYLGRIDNQVKIRGFRIELGEIETAIAKYPGVKDAVVNACTDKNGENRLVAYYIAPQSLDSKQLRECLKAKLPDYMMPSAWVQLEVFPLTPNGKCDLKSLPIPDFESSTSKYIAPRNSTETSLTKIWQEVLNLEQIGINDNFFELGGHSLLATQISSKIRHSLAIELPLRCLFEYPTIAELAPQLKSHNLTEKPPIKPIARERDLPLSFAQARLWFLAQLEPDNPAYNIPEAIRLQGELDLEILTKTIAAIIQRHETLRTNFKIIADEPVQIIHSEIDFQLSTIDLSTVPQISREQEVRKLTETEALKPFDLAKDSLLRVTLIRLHEVEHIVLFTMHHIISDGWSTGILVQEVATLYPAFLVGKPSPLPELPIQYADYAVWQREWLQGEVLDRQLSYWKQKLGGQLPVLKLPYREQKPIVKTNRSQNHSFTLSQDLTSGLEQLSRQTETSLFMVVLATLKTLLYRYTQQDDIVVGADIANRNQSETEGLIGFFVNLLVLRTDLSGYPSFRDLLTRVRKVTLSAYAHQDLPFDRLAQELQPSRQLNQGNLFQVLLVMDNLPITELELPGLTISSLAEVDSRAKFDLVLFISETTQGMVGNWQYNDDLFEHNAIAKLSAHYVTLLENIVSQPDQRINKLEMITQSEKEVQTMAEVTQEKSKFNKFLNIKPKAVSLPSSEELIKVDFLPSASSIPLVITPGVKDLDIFDWVKNERKFLEDKLLKHGAILFRNCQLNSIADFEKLAQAICPNLFSNYGDLPRTGVSDKVYGSTPYPNDKTIFFHNESSHLHCYPQKIWFFCVEPAAEGGETPIADCRQVYKFLDAQLREKLEDKQLMYVRNYIEGLDVSWQDFFHTQDKSLVESQCRKSKMEFEWLSNNGLRTRKIRPAISQHPITQEKTFFNQVQLHHISYLDAQVRESLLSLFGEDSLPRNVYYGDGTALEPEDIQAINQAYQQATISFPWQKGDVLMLDNLLTAHSRNPYKGKRKIVVSMGEIISNE